MSDDSRPAAAASWKPADLWRRLLAKVADAALFLLLLSPAVDYGIRRSFAEKNIGPFALATLLFPLVEAVFVRYFQGTPGKRMMGLRIVRLDGASPGWSDSLHRQWLLLVLMASQSLQVASVLPDPSPQFDLSALAAAIQESPSNWGILSDLASAALLASSLLVLFRPDRRSFQDIMGTTIVVQAIPPPRQG